MYEALVARVRYHIQKAEFIGLKKAESTLLLKEAADAIEALSKLALSEHNRAAKLAWERRWIPVAERLPECDLGAEVGNIEWISCGMVHAGCFGRGGKYRDAYFRTWTDAGEGKDAKDADYWRAVTLPQGPEEE